MEPTEEDTGQIEERIQQLEKQLDGVRKRTREMLSNRDSTNESFTIEAAQNLEKHKNSKLFKRFMEQENRKLEAEKKKQDQSVRQHRPASPDRGDSYGAIEEPSLANTSHFQSYGQPMEHSPPRGYSPRGSPQQYSPPLVNRMSDESRGVRFDPVYNESSPQSPPEQPSAGTLSYESPVGQTQAEQYSSGHQAPSSRGSPPAVAPNAPQMNPRGNISMTSENELEGYSQHIPSDYGPRQPQMPPGMMQSPFMPPMYPPYFYPPAPQAGDPYSSYGGGWPQPYPMMMPPYGMPPQAQPSPPPGQMQALQKEAQEAKEARAQLQAEIDKMKNEFNDILYEKDIEIFNLKKAGPGQPEASGQPAGESDPQQSQQLTADLEAANFRIGELEGEVRDLKQRLEKATQANFDLKTEKQNLQMDHRSLEEQLAHLNEENKDYRSDMGAIKKEHALEVERLQKELARANSHAEKLEVANQNLQQDFIDMEHRYKQEKSEASNWEINQLRTKLNHTQRLMDEKSESYRELQREYSDLLMDTQRSHSNSVPNLHDPPPPPASIPTKPQQQKKTNDSASVGSALHWQEPKASAPQPNRRATVDNPVKTQSSDVIGRLENNLLSLQMEKKHLDSEYAKLPEHGKTIAQRNRKEELEREIDILDTNIENIKTKLRNMNALHQSFLDAKD